VTQPHCYAALVLGRTYDVQNCSAARALELVGERWSLLIIRDALFRGITRFADFQRSLGLARNILAARLNRFVEEGLMERRPAEGSPYHEYVLTEKGRDLQPIIISLTHWGDRWAAPDGPPVIFEHGRCGGNIEQRIVCADCGEVSPAHEVIARGAPGVQIDRA
jgi:DNA-binding HxlR family transcriptional regulator